MRSCTSIIASQTITTFETRELSHLSIMTYPLNLHNLQTKKYLQFTKLNITQACPHQCTTPHQYYHQDTMWLFAQMVHLKCIRLVTCVQVSPYKNAFGWLRAFKSPHTNAFFVRISSAFAKFLSFVCRPKLRSASTPGNI